MFLVMLQRINDFERRLQDTDNISKVRLEKPYSGTNRNLEVSLPSHVEGQIKDLQIQLICLLQCEKSWLSKSPLSELEDLKWRWYIRISSMMQNWITVKNYLSAIPNREQLLKVVQSHSQLEKNWSLRKRSGLLESRLRKIQMRSSKLEYQLTGFLNQIKQIENPLKLSVRSRIFWELRFQIWGELTKTWLGIFALSKLLLMGFSLFWLARVRWLVWEILMMLLFILSTGDWTLEDKCSTSWGTTM